MGQDIQWFITKTPDGGGYRVREATLLGYKDAMEGDSINVSHPSSNTRRGRVGHGVAQTLLTGLEQVVVVGSDDA